MSLIILGQKARHLDNKTVEARPSAGAVGDAFKLTDDNAHPHRTIFVNAYLQQQGLERMEESARFPDLHFLEYILITWGASWPLKGLPTELHISLKNVCPDMEFSSIPSR
ncbi:hypothetical protein AVEN_22794-1 [Araneus ventricosus]|uniref:Uncharacterized protein n=1 Tax=Araneus ventricosus TaxID=182803 RepID=A0A4Y2EAU2_ARAVE|nr:hypothetical protein AVEN_22794-1 [Araneus ventricosus]